MAKCELCGKSTIRGQSGMHQHGGMWARRAPISRRQWRPNIRRVRVTVGSATKTMTICAACLKSRVKTERQ